MARKHLRELLVEDQEPFLLEAYISDRRRQLNKPPRPLARRKSASLGDSLLKNANACFSSSSSSSSPLPPRFDAAATILARAKTAGNNTVLLRVPTRTAALLLEAALRIENCDPMGRDPADSKKQGKSGEAVGVGTVESLFRKFSRLGRWLRKNEFGGSKDEEGVLVRDILGWNDPSDRQGPGKASTSKTKSSYAGNCPCSTSKQSTAPPHESRGGRESFGDSEGSDLKRSPFHYPTPELLSPTISPARSLPKDRVNFEENDPREIRPDEPEEEHDVEKEQSSPVSVLDPPSSCDDDDNVREHGHAEEPDNDEYADGLDYEASYTRTRQQLLRKLYRFERLAGLDPVELEGRLIEHDDSEDEDGDGDVSSYCGGDDSAGKTGLTRGMIKLASDLIVGDQQQHKQIDHGGIGKLMQGYFRQHGMVRRDQEDHYQHLEDTEEEIEVSILGFLVEEFLEDLCLKRSFD